MPVRPAEHVDVVKHSELLARGIGAKSERKAADGVRVDEEEREGPA